MPMIRPWSHSLQQVPRLYGCFAHSYVWNDFASVAQTLHFTLDMDAVLSLAAVQHDLACTTT